MNLNFILEHDRFALFLQIIGSLYACFMRPVELVPQMLLQTVR